MKMARMMIQIPPALKRQLDALRQRGTTASGFVRSLIEREFQQSTSSGKER